MSDDNKQKGNWRLLLVGVVLVSVITVGGFWITLLDFNKAKNSVFNMVKNVNWGFSETKVITTNTERNEQGKIIKITESEQTQPGKTFWDGLDLSSRLLVPLLIFIFGLWFQKRDEEKDKAEQTRRKDEQKAQAQLERELAQNNLDEEVIQKYLDDMAKLLLDEKYREGLFPNVNDKLNPGCDNPVRNVARTQTITILRRLKDDTKLQDRIVNFLRDAELYEFIFKNANLSEVNLQEVNLSNAELQRAKLWGAKLQGAYLPHADLQRADLWGADLQGADLLRADLQGANLLRADLQGANLLRAKLQETDLSDAKLQETKLSGANLQGAKLSGANLQGANLLGANLQGAKLSGAKLQGANLSSAIFTAKQIKSACFWDQAIYEGLWIWDKQTETWVPKNEQAEQDNTNYIEDLKRDESSDPEEPVDYSPWEKQ